MLGKDLLIAANGRVIAAQRTCNLNLQQDTIEVCSPVSGPWREYIPSTLGWDVSCDGLIYAPEYADELMEVLTRRQKVRLSYYDPELRIVRSGYAIPTGLQQGASINSLATYALTFQGSGELGRVEPVVVRRAELEHWDRVHDVDFKRDKNHNLVYNNGADMYIELLDVERLARVTVRAINMGDDNVACIVRLGGTSPDALCDMIDEMDNLRFFQLEVAHLGGKSTGMSDREVLMMPKGQYAVVYEGHNPPNMEFELVSLPTE